MSEPGLYRKAGDILAAVERAHDMSNQAFVELAGRVRSMAGQVERLEAENRAFRARIKELEANE